MKPENDDRDITQNTLNIDIVPNPASNGIRLKLISQNQISNDMNIIIYNDNGRIVSNQQFVPSMAKEYQMDISNIPNGKYFVSVKVGDLQTTETLMIIK